MQTNTLDETLEQRLANSEYKRWVKAVMCLNCLKEGLENFAQKESKDLHVDIFTTVTAKPCGKCKEIQYLCPACRQTEHEIQKRHNNKPCWENTNIEKWSDCPNSHWFIAKCYMNAGQTKANSAQDSDISALLNFIINYRRFQQISKYGHIQRNAEKVRENRNAIFHNGRQKLSDLDLTSYTDNMLELLELLKLLEYDTQAEKLKRTRDAETAQTKIEDILKASFVITLEDETNIRLAAQERDIVELQTTEKLRDKKHQEDIIYLRTKSSDHDNKIDQIEKKVMELKTDVKHMEETSTLKKRVETIEQTMQALTRKIEEVPNKQEADLVELAGRIRTLMQPTEKEPHPKRRAESNDLIKLKDRTGNRLGARRKLEYIPTTQAENAKRLLESKHYVLIKGNPGEGKTTMALHLIDQDNYQGTRVLISSPREWENVDIDWVDIVIIEDIFGQFDLDSGRLQDWMVHLRTIQEYVDSGKLQLIITSRVDILTKAYSKIRFSKLFCDDLSVILSSEKLNHAEKMIILNSELLRNSRAMTDDEKEKCITNFSGLIGFPQCCFLFAGHVELFDRGPEFFRSPEHFFAENITMLDEARFLSLAFLFCNDETLEEHLSPETMPEPSKRLLAELATHLHILETNVSIQLLRDSYESFMGLYTVKSMSAIKFAHATVFEVVGQVLADRCVEMVVRYSDSEYLYQRTYTAIAKDTTSQNVFLPVCVYGLLAERMVHDIVDEHFVRSVVQHSALRQHTFLMKLKDELEKVNRIKDFFTAKPYIESIFGPLLSGLQGVGNKVQMTIYMFNIKLPPVYRHRLSEGECSTFMQYVLQCDEDVVQLVYSQLLELLACSHTNNSSDCWKCKEKQSLLELALHYQRFQIADELITMRATYTHLSLCNAARHGDLIRVQTILQTLKMSHTFTPESEEAKDALCRAYISGNQDLVELLLNESVKLNSRHVAYAAQHGDLNVLMNMVEHLKSHNNWNPHSEHTMYKKLFPPIRCFGEILSDSIRPVFSALYITLSEEKFQMAEYLIKNEVGLTLDLLVYLSGSGSHHAVTKLIQYFKVAGIWDPHSYCASKALEHAYIAQNFEVFDLLVHKGVSFTIQSLAVIVVFQPSLTSVKKVIQHLKDTDNWDSKCDDASEALEMTWNQKHGVCDLLIEEGVTLRMKNLPGVLNGVSLESAKKAIEHLKGSGNWNCNCDEASEALENSYGQEDYDVIDLLVKEGVTLKMKNFPAAVMEAHNALKSALKAIQHLKATDNWDSMCEDASKALEIAYIQQKYDVVDLLIAEKATLTMKNLPGVIAASLPVETVKKVIERLKYTHNWDSNCHDASKALEIAYIQNKKDKCDLLTEEKVTLTMTNLPFVMVDSLSLECIKKIIQSLKDTDNWDSTCQDASKTLEIAYQQQNKDVLDMLVQEGVSLQMNNFPGAIMGSLKSLEFVEKAIADLQSTGKWDSKCDDASKALVAACIREQHDVFNMLAREGVELEMGSLQYIIMSLEVSLESVKKAIQHLRDFKKWDCKSPDAINLLVNAFCIENYDVCDLLVQEGVTLTMKNLLDVAKIASLEAVKKAIQYLKQTYNWDSKCGDASTVLMVYYVRQMHDVCDFLINEGIALTMTNLPFLVANCVPLVSVKKAVQHLKGNNNWHCKCDDAIATIVIAYHREKYDVCSMLFEAGLILTMKDLPTLLCNVSLESVKKCIQDMKDTNNWNSKCDDASNSLAFMYIQQKYDACALMVQEGVTLAMKDLAGVVAVSASLKSVKKAIRHLTDTGNWDTECDGASKALLIAFLQQKDAVCEMLIQKGFSLKMTNLHEMVYNITLEAVQNTLKHLKDNTNCGSEYDVASKVLEIAYGKQEYSSFHTLAQEALTLALPNHPGVVFPVSLDPIEKAIKHLKETNNWVCTCDDAVKALVIAYSKQRYDVCALLVQEGLTLTMMCLGGVVSNSSSIQTVHKAVQHLRENDNLDPKCEDASKALLIAYSEQKYDVCSLLVQEGLALTMKNLPGVVANSAQLESVRKAIKHLMDNDKWDSTCDDATKALVIAYCQQKYNICALLVQEKLILTMKNLPEVVANCVESESVKKAIQHLKENDMWDSTCDDAPKALVIAYSQQKCDVCALLVQDKLILTMNNLPEVVANSVSLESVKKAIQHLKDNDKWDSTTCDDAPKALVIAYSQEKYDLCDLLIQEKLILTMKNLPEVVANSVSLEPVKKAIQHLKDNDTWDFTCDDAPQALVIAYSQEKYDLCDLLIREKLILTMKNLPEVVANSVSLESVKKAIQHQKDNDKWDSTTCDDATEALVIAYSEQKYDVCALLIQEKIILTMKNLPEVVGNSVSLESVKKAIQHLKDNDKWDFTCDDAPKALMIAYSQEKYDLCDLLIQEKLILTMKNLPGVVANSVSLESVKKATQHLKDNDEWDSTCDDAPKALVIAYTQQKYDVCAFLIQEKIILTMKNLPDVVANSVSLESVKKAIQHIKVNDKWDSTAFDDAPKALVIAYSQQKHDLCDLLIQEKLILTMKNLPRVVANSVSLESVKKATQHLKDNDKWDSTCDDARKALVIAYRQQKYDVCAFLIQEKFILTMKNIPDVVANSVSLESVKKAIQHLKDNDKWESTTCDDAPKALVIAYSQEKYDLCDLLIQEKLILTMKNLPEVVADSVSLESVKRAIQHLKDNDKWDSTCDDATKALVIAYRQQKYDVCAFLIQEKIILTMKNLPDVVANSVSLESVKKAIQHLKDHYTWDSTCDDAPKALAIAYSQQMYNVCALLIQEKCILTMKNLPGLVAKSVSLESVKNAIQHLKDNDKWDYTCDDAPKSLVIAYSQQKYDVCALLVQEKLILTMKNLPGLVANRVSLESVKKAIQHLKDNDKWESTTCDDAPKALVIAYSQEKYDLCDLLIQEKLILTMKNLPGVVANSVSLESVKKATQHLKDNDKWDSTCDDARKALVIAYRQQKYDVCAFLIQEKFRLTMKYLPDVVANSVSLESVKKAIQHLKDNDTWDSTCDDASTSLEVAYSHQKYDICVLLVHEGIILRMANLPGVVAKSMSSESVKKAIQYLKDCTQWDASCLDGFKALIHACKREKYDVFVMLFQEGITLTMQILPYVVANSVSLKSVKNVIQHLKDTGNWDTYKCDYALRATQKAYLNQQYDVFEFLVFEEFLLTMPNLPNLIECFPLQTVEKAIKNLKDMYIWDSMCIDASKSLEIAYINQKYDVCELLVQEKVKLKMENLPGIVDCKLVESVKKAIQHLKDFDNWDSKCHDASKAMEIAWKQKYDVCDLLVHEAFTLTMKNLPGLVSSESLEYVKKAIQHLKDNNNWDSKCDDASKALEMAWYQTNDVCDLLLHEGVTLAMPNLPGVVINSQSIESVKKAIQHLQDNNNWDSKCHDAQRGLEFAYRVHKNDVCDLLVEAGATLIMANLPGVVRDVSLKYVKKAMQHLKDNENWHPNGNDASTALEIAYGVYKYDVIDTLVQDGVTLTMKNLPGVVQSLSCQSVKKAIQHLKDTNKWDPKCDSAAAALEIAYREDMNEAFRLLTQEGVTLIISCLPDLVHTESPESVKKVIQLLKDTDNWNPKSDDASHALEVAYIKQKYSVCDLLVMEGVALTMNNFPSVVDHMSLKTIEKAMEHLKYTDVWDPKSDHAAKALEIALSKQKYDVFDRLFQKGVTLTMKNIPGVVDSVSLQSVQKALQLLKCTGNWDSKSNDASKALEIGWKNTYLIDLLVKEGVTLTMKSLPFIVYHVSWESANKAIQHLKDNGNWNFKSDDASEALEVAYTKQRYNMIDVLVQEGVKLTMKNIPGMVGIAPLTLINKAVQHLKDNNKWDPKCDHASDSLETALIEQKYEVFDLLVQEGVVLTMKHFPGVVESMSMKSVKKAIQYLKDIDNWDPKCADAIRALEIAWKHRCNLYDLLVQEKVILPMQNLPGMIDTVSYKELNQHFEFTLIIMNPRELMHLKN